MKRLFVVSCILVLAIGLAIPVSAASKPIIELKLGHNASVKSGSHAGFMEPWARNVEKATNGRVKITIYPGQTLFKAREAIVATQQGITDLAWVLVAFFPGRFPLTDVTSLPFLNLTRGKVDGRELEAGEINSHILMEVFEKFPEMQAEWPQIKPLILHTSGPTNLFSNKHIKMLSDVEGLKVRSYSGPDAKMWKLLGASPIAMPLPAVYESAEKGVLEAANVDFGGVKAYRLYEVMSYRVNVNITVGHYALVMNQAKWNSLPSDIQKIIEGLSGVPGAEFAGRGMTKGAGAALVADEVRAKAKEMGKPLVETDFSSADLDEWRRITDPLSKKYIADLEARGLPAQKVYDETLRLVELYGK